MRARTAEDPPQRIRDKGQQQMLGEAAWPVGENRSSGEKKRYLSNFISDTSLRSSKGRWICEYQSPSSLKQKSHLVDACTG
jgi:hypothetical protein